MSESEHAGLTPAQVERLIAETEPWLSCDDCFDQIDAYVDDLAGGSPGVGEPLRVHLINCPACFEEAESLISLIAADSGGVSADALLAAFRTDLHRHDRAATSGSRWIDRLRRRR